MSDNKDTRNFDRMYDEHTKRSHGGFIFRYPDVY